LSEELAILHRLALADPSNMAIQNDAWAALGKPPGAAA
jgi:hypothetical protein